MFFPIKTDAPSHYFPTATLVLIAVNVGVSLFTVIGTDPYLGDPEFGSLMLQFDRIAPVQWLTCHFLHADMSQLIVNMIFLWIFGYIVEGIAGWARFLSIYFLTGILSGCIVQLLMKYSGVDGVSLGSAGIVLGLMATTILWAPKNVLICATYMRSTKYVDVPIFVFTLIFAAINILFLIVRGFHQLSSELLHITGLFVGGLLGYLMIRFKLVDCQGWDYLSVYYGDENNRRLSRSERRNAQAQRLKMREERNHQLEIMCNSIKEAMKQNNAEAVINLYASHRDDLRKGKFLDDGTLLSLIRTMHAENRASELVELLVESVRRFDDERAVNARIRLAQVLTQSEERPRQAIAVLEKLPESITEEQKQRVSHIVDSAMKIIDNGAVEIEIFDW